MFAGGEAGLTQSVAKASSLVPSYGPPRVSRDSLWMKMGPGVVPSWQQFGGTSIFTVAGRGAASNEAYLGYCQWRIWRAGIDPRQCSLTS